MIYPDQVLFMLREIYRTSFTKILKSWTFLQIQPFQAQPSFQRNLSNRLPNSSQIICHYCGIPRHKAPDCRTKKQDDASSGKSHANNYTDDELLYLFSAIAGTPNVSSSWYLDPVTICYQSNPYSEILRSLIFHKPFSWKIIASTLQLALVLFSYMSRMAQVYLFQIYYMFRDLPKICCLQRK